MTLRNRSYMVEKSASTDTQAAFKKLAGQGGKSFFDPKKDAGKTLYWKLPKTGKNGYSDKIANTIRDICYDLKNGQAFVIDSVPPVNVRRVSEDDPDIKWQIKGGGPSGEGMASDLIDAMVEFGVKSKVK